MLDQPTDLFSLFFSYIMRHKNETFFLYFLMISFGIDVLYLFVSEDLLGRSIWW